MNINLIQKKFKNLMLKVVSKIRSNPAKYFRYSTLTEKTDDRKNSHGLKVFMSDVYRKMALGVTSSFVMALGTSALCPTEIMMSTAGFCSFTAAGFVMGLSGCYGISSTEPMYRTITVNEESEEILVSIDQPVRELSFYALIAGVGLSMAPEISWYLQESPLIVPIGITLSTFVFGACSYLSTKIKDTTLMKWQVPLIVGLVGLLGLQLANIGSYLLLGPSHINALLSSIDINFGLILFTGLSIYDSHMARQFYHDGKPDVTLCVTQLYLDFMIILRRIWLILYRNRS